MKSIHDYWVQLITQYTSDTVLIEKLFDEVKSSYSESSRHYHTLSHLEALLKFSEEYQSQLQYKRIVDFAIFYHDVVYKSTRSDNEEKSAQIANERLLQINFPDAERKVVVDFILATKSHAIQPSLYENDLKWFLDFDLSVLGATEEVYLEYVSNIRKEFKIYPDLLYKPGRRKVLQHFLEMDFIFKTEEFRGRFEKQARINLQKELELLK